MTGDLLDTETVETDAGTFEIALRFTDWEMPDHRDTRGYAIPRYSVRIEAPDGEAESFTGWGSIHEGETGELSNTDAIQWAENVALDGLTFYEECDGTHGLLDRPLTASSLQDDLAPMVDNLAAEFGYDQPSEAVRVLGGIMDTARRLRGIGLDYHALRDFYEAVREKLEE